jgi:hypothetical protein
MIKVLPFIIIGFLGAFSIIILLIASMTDPSWVTFEDFMDNDYTWGLFTCSECPDESAEMQWECWRQAGCEEDNDSARCLTGTDLHQAGMAWYFFALGALLCMIFVAQKTLYMVIGTEFGSKITIYVALCFSALFQFLGIAIWGGVSNASFSECDENSEDVDDNFNVCASSGPYLAIIALIGSVVLIPLIILSINIYMPRVKAELDVSASKKGELDIRHSFCCVLVLLIITVVFLIASVAT